MTDELTKAWDEACDAIALLIADDIHRREESLRLVYGIAEDLVVKHLPRDTASPFADGLREQLDKELIKLAEHESTEQHSNRAARALGRSILCGAGVVTTGEPNWLNI